MQPSPENKPKRKRQAKNEKRPDPLFKQLMTDAAREAKLEKGPTELQIAQTTSTDMLLNIPPSANVENTLFDFFRAVNVVEFKSASDTLTEEAFMVQLARVYLLFAERKSLRFAQILNVIVSSRYPREFFSYSEEQGHKFEPEVGREWLFQAQIGYQDVRIVVCEMLPLEPRYAPWLIFADAGTQKWRDFIIMTALERDFKLLELAREMRPEEYDNMTSELGSFLDKYSPTERIRIKENWMEFLSKKLPELTKNDPEGTVELLSLFESEALISTVLKKFSADEKKKLRELLPEQDADTEK